MHQFQELYDIQYINRKVTNVLFDKDIILATFYFTNDQEPMNYQMTEGCSIEFIGYIDLEDFREIWPKHSWDNDEQTWVRKFCYLT